ncbi:MAG TPA: type II toxin-antitoxin system prevent-host-death family antitoxin [Acidimicrobiia bacterium]|nr:type II toxin-antitoxin system prevent-host-death family antitoxin [Acidimicrobiia bacterium]
MEVGIRALRNQLSEFVERVRGGEELVVTDRGRPVARLVPVGGERVLDRLIREGLVEPAPVRERRRPNRRTPARGGAGDLLERR